MKVANRPIVVIGVNATGYLRRIADLLSEAGYAPAVIFLGSRAARMRFKYESLRRILRQLGVIEVFHRLRRARYLQRRSVASEIPSLSELVERYGIPVETFDDVNEGRLLFRLFGYENPIVVLAGTGLVGKSFLTAVGGTCLNGHPALLPGTRGVDVAFWDLHDGRPLGVTAHDVVREVDAGSIRKRLPISPREGEDVSQFLFRLEMLQAEAVVSSVIEEIEGRPHKEINDISLSRLKYAAPNTVFKSALGKLSSLTGVAK